MASREPVLADDADIKVYLREVGAAIPAVARAVEMFGDEVLQLWMEQTTKAVAQVGYRSALHTDALPA